MNKEYLIPFSAPERLGDLYDRLLRAYSELDYDETAKVGPLFLSELLEDILRSADSDDPAAKAERDRENAIDMALERR